MANLPEKPTIQKALLDYRAERQLDIAAVAKQARVRVDQLEKIERGNFEGIEDYRLMRLWQLVNPAVYDEPVIETGNFNTVIKVCKAAQEHQLMVALIGDTGLGKTTSLMAYRRRPNVFYVLYEKSMNPKVFFISLMREMGINLKGSINDMVKRAAHELSILENPLIVIDEAGKLPVTLLMYLHDLRNQTQNTSGILLAGMPYFKVNLESWVSKQKEGASEFYRRVQLWQELQPPTRAEIKAICILHGITDPATVKNMQKFRDFGNLSNAILLEKLMLNQF
ncbi:AAA family ATPase [Rufibacter sp. LB8]|uniref:AAA family ATPase n=1 Tax=Rufibacter sp. LB8 TaxID=2777781 RepID=UPI00178C267D|nr:AAA family ATPase [Rufibacter sp. LB8]